MTKHNEHLSKLLSFDKTMTSKLTWAVATKNYCVTWNVRVYANLDSSFRAYLTSIVSPWFSNSFKLSTYVAVNSLML